MLSLIINGRHLKAREGATILDTCHSAGIRVPTLCHDPRLTPSGACRLCVVEVEGMDRYVSACTTLVQEGMVIQTQSEGVQRVRRCVISMLAENHPHDAQAFPPKPFDLLRAELNPAIERVSGDEAAPRCAAAAGGEPFRDNSHPYIVADLSRCVLCFRCVRICDELQGQQVWQIWNRNGQTAVRPREATLLASGCVSCGACVDTCPTGSLEDHTVAEHGEPNRWTRTVCPYCGVGCEILAGTRNTQIVQVKPAMAALVNRGHLCAKGRYAFDFATAPDRAVEPMIRYNGRWNTASWQDAIALVAERLTRLVELHGPDSIGVLASARATNEENYLAQKFARVVLGTNNVDCCARVCHAPSAAALGELLGVGAATGSFDDIECAATILLCGCNPTENHPVIGARIKQAARRGAKLIVIDPRVIELAKAATIHLQLRPGTNIPLLNAVAQVIVTEGLVAESVKDMVAGYAEFRAGIEAWTPERAAGICDVAPDLIREAARLFATHSPALSLHGLGVTEHIQGTDGVRSLANLALLCGNIGKRGAGIHPLRGQNNVHGAAQMGCEPSRLTGYQPIDNVRALFESIWGVPIPLSHGKNLLQMIDAAAAGELHGLWVIGHDIAVTNPNAGETRRGLKNLDLLVGQDMFLNGTIQEFGHVFLPACSSFEKDGTFMNSERRVQRVREVLEPRGWSKPDWKIICDLAREMGFGAQFNFNSPEEIWEEIRTVWKAGAGITYDRLSHAGLQWPCPEETHAGTAILHEGGFAHGKPRLTVAQFTPSAQRPDDKFPLLLTTGRNLYQFNAGTMTTRTPNVELRSEDTLDVSPIDAKHLSVKSGDRVVIRSRHGEATLPVRLDPTMRQGELFATFHTAPNRLNAVIGSGKDTVTDTPEYKVTAVRVEKLRTGRRPQP